MALERELATYEQRLDELRLHTGKFVLIHGNDVIDYFSAYDDALAAGYARFGLEEFLVNQISVPDTAQYITRSILPSGLAGAA